MFKVQVQAFILKCLIFKIVKIRHRRYIVRQNPKGTDDASLQIDSSYLSIIHESFKHRHICPLPSHCFVMISYMEAAILSWFQQTSSVHIDISAFQD